MALGHAVFSTPLKKGWSPFFAVGPPPKKNKK
jgi:hypothetical protein